MKRKNLVRLMILSAGLTTFLAQGQTRPSIVALQAQVDGMQSTIDSQQSQITLLQNALATDSIPGIAGYLAMDTTVPSRPTLRLSGANLQIANGLGGTDTLNGLGNVIIGYDENRPVGTPPECSTGVVQNPNNCTGVWAVDQKGGSHNLVIGPNHNYSGVAGYVAGFKNSLHSNWSSISGGTENKNYAVFSSIAGGRLNVTGVGTSITVTGGVSNFAYGSYSSITGGELNTASGAGSSVNGGYFNTASGAWATVSGGVSNAATGTRSTVSGGSGLIAGAINGWRAGQLAEQ